MDRANPYSVLGVTPTATQAEITRAYRAQARALHPDTRSTPAQTPRDSDNGLGDVLAAYGLLRDPERRAAYDHIAERSQTTVAKAVTTVAPTVHIHVSTAPARTPVTHIAEGIANAVDQQPLWAGPVRHHR